jgi:hypothetical protein
LVAKLIAKSDPQFALKLLQTFCFSPNESTSSSQRDPAACLLGGDIAFDFSDYNLAQRFYTMAYTNHAYREAKYGKQQQQKQQRY